MDDITKTIYLINPRNDHYCYFGMDVFESTNLKPKVFFLDQSITTIAAMAKAYLNVILCEEHVQDVDFDITAEFIGITGKVTQWNRMKYLATKFKEKGKIIVIGGPFASLCPEFVKPYCDVLVIGEIEEIYKDIFQDLALMRYQKIYKGNHPNLSNCILPDLSLYPNSSTWSGTIQITRGCPHKCEFCSVIQYLGRKLRYKSKDLVLQELDLLFKSGYRDIFITDDNFTGNFKKAKEYLSLLIKWNEINLESKKVSFSIQMSMDAIEDEELLILLSQANVDYCLLGVETPNQKSLDSVGKNQNVSSEMVSQINKLVEYCIQPMAGIIVGFDTDTIEIFSQMNAFISILPIPILSIGALSAPHHTPLYNRLFSEGRIIDDLSFEGPASPSLTNVIPKLMSREQLEIGMKWLCSNVYHPFAFQKRLELLINNLNYKYKPWYVKEKGQVDIISDRDHFHIDSIKIIDKLSQRGLEEKLIVKELEKLATKRPFQRYLITSYLVHYEQIRHFYDSVGFFSSQLYKQPISIS